MTITKLDQSDTAILTKISCPAQSWFMSEKENRFDPFAFCKLDKTRIYKRRKNTDLNNYWLTHNPTLSPLRANKADIIQVLITQICYMTFQRNKCFPLQNPKLDDHRTAVNFKTKLRLTIIKTVIYRYLIGHTVWPDKKKFCNNVKAEESCGKSINITDELSKN